MKIEINTVMALRFMFRALPQPITPGEVDITMAYPVTSTFALPILKQMMEEEVQQITLHHGVANDDAVPADTRAHHEEMESIHRNRWNALAWILEPYE